MYEKYIEIINSDGGIITSKEANKKGISRTVLSQMVKDNVLERIERGIYATEKYVYDEIYIFQIKHSNIIFSYNTALYLLNKTERTPEKLDVTTTRNNSLSYCKNIANIYRVNDEIINLGKIKVKTNTGKDVYAYNLERTIVDIISNRDAMSIELSNKIIRNCIKEKSFNANLMFEYAKKMKVYDKIKNYMEAII